MSRQALKRLRRRDGCPRPCGLEDREAFPYWKASPSCPHCMTFSRSSRRGISGISWRRWGSTIAHPAPWARIRPCTGRWNAERGARAQRNILGRATNRRLAFRQLTGHDLRIWGNDWDGETTLAPYLQKGGARIDTEEVVRIFNATLFINVNLHSSVRPGVLVGDGISFNPRTSSSLLAELFSWWTGARSCPNFSPKPNQSN